MSWYLEQDGVPDATCKFSDTTDQKVAERRGSSLHDPLACVLISPNMQNKAAKLNIQSDIPEEEKEEKEEKEEDIQQRARK